MLLSARRAFLLDLINSVRPSLRAWGGSALIGFTVVAFAFGGTTAGSSRVGTGVAPSAPPQEEAPATTGALPPSSVPEYIPYRFLFHHLIVLSEQAAENELEGGKSDLLPQFQAKAGLSDAQFQLLMSIARDSERDVAEIDARAKAIIDEFRSKYPPGKLPRGTGLPPPPPELRALQQTKSATILGARDRVAQVLDTETFARFDAFVQMKFAPSAGATIPARKDTDQ